MAKPITVYYGSDWAIHALDYWTLNSVLKSHGLQVNPSEDLLCEGRLRKVLARGSAVYAVF
jgi:hypothetical protein